MLQKSKIAIVMVVLIALLSACGIAANGEPGVGINNIVNNEDGTFTIYLTDASSYIVGNFTGPQGPQGLAGVGFDKIAWQTVSPSGTTSSTSWTDLSTSGPSVGFGTTGGPAIVILTAYIQAAPNYRAYMSFEVSGATTISPSESRSLMQENGSSVGGIQASAVYFVNLENGFNVITVYYKVTGGTGTFAYRSVTVIPIELP